MWSLFLSFSLSIETEKQTLKIHGNMPVILATWKAEIRRIAV
jgi:hypothetical protein